MVLSYIPVTGWQPISTTVWQGWCLRRRSACARSRIIWEWCWQREIARCSKQEMRRCLGFMMSGNAAFKKRSLTICIWIAECFRKWRMNFGFWGTAGEFRSASRQATIRRVSLALWELSGTLFWWTWEPAARYLFTPRNTLRQKGWKQGRSSRIAVSFAVPPCAAAEPMRFWQIFSDRQERQWAQRMWIPTAWWSICWRQKRKGRKG